MKIINEMHINMSTYRTSNLCSENNFNTNKKDLKRLLLQVNNFINIFKENIQK